MKTMSGIQAEIQETRTAAPHIIGNSGPKTLPGKQRVAMNAVTHGLTGQNVFLEEAEYAAYMDLGAQYIAELRPVGIRETQIAQKIIDSNWRLNTISAVENNLFHSSRLASLRDNDPNDNGTVGMVSKATAWQKDCQGPNCFEKIGRHEARLQRLLFKSTEELERLQAIRLRKEDDTFVAAECKAWVWYDRMLALHRQLAAAREIRGPQPAPAAAPEIVTAAVSGTSGSELFCKKPETKDASPVAPSTFAAGSGSVEHAAPQGSVTPARQGSVTPGRKERLDPLKGSR